MSVVTPTVLPRPPVFPHLLPNPPQPHPKPLPKYSRVYSHLNKVRDLQREMDDLSEEETELEDLNMLIHNRGYTFLIPIGRSLTQQEEKNDADDDESEGETGSAHSAVAPSIVEGDVEQEDIDASMEDLDADTDADITGDADDADETVEEYEDEV